MDRLIVDTAILVAVERRHLDSSVIPDEAEIAVAAITVSELLVGVELARGRRRERRQRLVDEILEAVQVIAFDRLVAEHHSELVVHARRAGRPRGAHDLQVAATARATGRRLIATDAAGFGDLPGVTVTVLPSRAG